MILEIRYLDSKAQKLNSVYVSFPDRYVDNSSIVERICQKIWIPQMLGCLNNKNYFECYSAFKIDFKRFLKSKFNIGDFNSSNSFYGIKVFEVPQAVPFIIK